MTNASTAVDKPNTAYLVILAISLCHLLNDVMQSLISSIYPLLQAEFALDFWQIGLLTFAFQVTASLLQPVVGVYTDKRPLPQSLTIGMGSTLIGLVFLALGGSYPMLLTGAMLIGIGSAVFHPEASRVARLASGGRFGMAQSLFQTGGNTGSAIGPLLAAFIVVPLGRPSVLWFSALALLGMAILWQVGRWYDRYRRASAGRKLSIKTHTLTRRRVSIAIFVLILLTFTKNIYTAGFTSYYTFFVIERFGLSAQQSQLMLFAFLAAMALGVMLGGPVGDRFGPLFVIWISVLGVLPFSLWLPYANLPTTIALSVVIGVLISASFPAILVYVHELVPGRIGLMNGMFFGFAFGMAGVAAAVLGVLADYKGIAFVYQISSYLPFLGLLTILLPRQAEIDDVA
ncbi:MFS transporter [Flavimaricola marinus]|uniref:Fosmidomycin resistance protein n=1 Tax=Flavimaricola marinus TaxID=1819565 RepID=A0A238LI38_9RHOB|nr:MFS transporter [Flavimaricola marinus]SMY09387.1 Fosmidomycin resistance protein [Flavimaricola marinus]